MYTIMIKSIVDIKYRSIFFQIHLRQFEGTEYTALEKIKI